MSRLTSMEEKPKFIPKTPAAMHESAIQRSLAALDDALKRCRTEDVRYAMAIAAPLSFLERVAVDKRPFERFGKALENFDADPVKAEARYQALSALLGEIRRAIGR